MVAVTGTTPGISCGFESIIPYVLMGAHDLPEDMSWSLHVTRSAGEMKKWGDI
jgi:hypothetical protein